MKTYRKAAKIFKALSSPIRINILMLLTEREHCACEFPRLLNISQPNSSRNLSVLKNAGLIESYRDGKKIIYYISNQEIRELIEIAKKLN
jgi:ArsR family transcriptional regulator